MNSDKIIHLAVRHAHTRATISASRRI